MDQRRITVLILSAVLLWAIYRRVRGNFGPQPVYAGRMKLRVALLTLVAALMLAVSARDVELLTGLLGGIGCGLALGYFGLRHTKLDATPQGRFYTPHTYLGLVISGLFIARLMFRFLTVPLDAGAVAHANQNPFDGYQKSPLTVAMFGLLIGYYILFNVGVLMKSAALATPDVHSADA
jgi:hypothetical protein